MKTHKHKGKVHEWALISLSTTFLMHHLTSICSHGFPSCKCVNVKWGSAERRACNCQIVRWLPCNQQFVFYMRLIHQNEGTHKTQSNPKPWTDYSSEAPTCPSPVISPVMGNRTEPAWIERGDWPNGFAAHLITHYLVKQRQGRDRDKGRLIEIETDYVFVEHIADWEKLSNGHLSVSAWSDSAYNRMIHGFNLIALSIKTWGKKREKALPETEWVAGGAPF